MRSCYDIDEKEMNDHSYPWLLAMYSQYPRRLCEQLGINPDKKNDDTTSKNEDLAIGIFESKRESKDKGDDLRDMFYKARMKSAKKGGGK